MPPSDAPDSSINTPLYNSRLIKNYVEYIKEFHPDVDTYAILRHAWITSYELEDEGHWFTQQQVDRFHELLKKTTADPNISRKVGRYAASSQASSIVKQYALGFMAPGAAYWVAEKLAPHLTRATSFKSKKLGPNKIEVSVTQNPGVSERPHQCDNRMGILEAIAKLFTNKFPKIEHPRCLHRGGDRCLYIITWDKTPSMVWERTCRYLIFLGLLMSGTLFFFVPLSIWLTGIFMFTSLILGISLRAEHLKKEDLANNIESQHDAARLLLDEINLRYNNAQLIKEIGQATAMFLDAKKLLSSVTEAMEKRLDFDRGGIWLANTEKTRLIYRVGYGYDPELEELLRNTDFHLDNPEAKGVAVQAFRSQEPSLVNDISEIEKDLSERSMRFVKRIGAHSFICAPIAYERESLGVLLVDNIKSKRPLSQSDMAVLMGIAPQIAISDHNAMSYQKLQESKERERKSKEQERDLRKLFEKYVPAPIIKRYLYSGEVDLFHGEEIPITALFLDIRGFTSSSETMDAMDVVSFLNDYFEKCSQIISREGGHINKYTGDGFLAIFGAPETLKGHATMAFNASCKILELCRKFVLGGKPMEVGIGIHTGGAILGNIGSQNKIEYTAIGDTVNTAARLQEFTKSFHTFPIIMSRDAWEELSRHPSHQAIRHLGKQKIRGKKEMLDAFGFNLHSDRLFPVAHENGGLAPLQRIKGV
jgi:class 3 adenylate cyclase